MKTPRELLLQKHSAAERKLDAVRAEVIQQMQRTAGGDDAAPIQDQRPRNVPFLLKLWTELVVPSRRVWGGLAAVWIVMIVANLSVVEDEAPAPASAKHFDSASELMAAMNERQRLMAELIATEGERPQPANRPSGLRPRSGRISPVRMA